MAFVPSIGQMRWVIQFNRVDKTAEGTGGNTETYSEWFVTRGCLRMKRNYREFETGYDESVKVYDLWVPWRNELESGISKDVRVVYEAREFGVDSFTLVDERRRIYKMELKEVR